MILSARICARILVVLVSAAVPCVAAEVVLRIVAPPADSAGLLVPRADELEHLGRPEAHGLMSGVPVAFNALGFRDRDRPSQPDHGNIRIIALGDSITFGTGVKEEDTFPRVTETLLNRARRDGDPSVEILNLGIPAYNTLHELVVLRRMGLAFHPDLVVLEFLYNDLDFSPRQRSALADSRGSRSGGTNEAAAARVPAAVREDAAAVPPSHSLTPRINATLEWLRRRSRFVSWFSPRAALVLRPLGVTGIGHNGDINERFAESSPDWRQARAALLEMKQLCDENGVRLAIAIIPAMTTFNESVYPIKAYHKAVSDFCRSSSIACVDLLPAFWGLDGMRFWISPTDSHPNAVGHRIIGEALAKFLEPELAGLGARP